MKYWQDGWREKNGLITYLTKQKHTKLGREQRWKGSHGKEQTRVGWQGKYVRLSKLVKIRFSCCDRQESTDACAFGIWVRCARGQCHCSNARNRTGIHYVRKGYQKSWLRVSRRMGQLTLQNEVHYHVLMHRYQWRSWSHREPFRWTWQRWIPRVLVIYWDNLQIKIRVGSHEKPSLRKVYSRQQQRRSNVNLHSEQ